MIIAFYPGAGGNRYYHYSMGRRDFTQHQTYDHLLTNQPFEYRYLDSVLNLPDQQLILTHCVNVPLLKQLFPNQTEIVVLQANLDQCLKREWYLEDQFRDKNMPNKLEHARAHVSYHYKYYNQYPMDTTGATAVIDITSDNSEFATSMKAELSSILSNEYDQAIKEHAAHDLNQLPGDKIVDGFKSQFLDDAETMKQRLDKISPSLCLAKWKQVSLHLTTGLNNSCYHPPLHRIPVDAIGRNPAALHNTDYKKQQRKQMLNGERPAECSYCWTMEDNGKLSDRHYRSGEPWAAKDFGTIVSAEWDADITPSYVEVNFNNACNLACSYCSPQFSSTWQQETDRHGAYPTSTPHNAPEHFAGDRKPIPVREHNPYVDAFWQWWPTLYPELEHFRMTGGEPLLDKNTYRVFDYVLANPKPDLHLNVTSNFSVDEKSWQKYLAYTKQLCQEGVLEHFMQYISLDGWGKQAEYMRHGMDFELVWGRVNQFLTEVTCRNSVTFIVTMNNLCVTSLPQLFDGILELRKKYSSTYQRVWFDTPVLRQPAWQSLQLLPESYVGQLEKLKASMQHNIETDATRFHGFKDYEIARLDRDISWMRDGQRLDSAYLQRNKADFYRFFTEADRRHKTEFTQVFPEMQSWWKECEYHARQS
jgi:organic radical activating enzyme